MPIYKTITVTSATKVYIWKVTETEDELSKDVQLTPHCQERLLGMKSQLHRRAFLSIRHLFAAAGFEDKDVYYNVMGKPFMHNGKYISITHSYSFTAIIVSSERPVGIDIEKQREKILRIAHKFTPFEEYRTLANTAAVIRKLTIVWGAKESLYKIYGQPGLSFLKHIHIDDFTFDGQKTQGYVYYEGLKTAYDISFLEFEGFTAAYALQQA